MAARRPGSQLTREIPYKGNPLKREIPYTGKSLAKGNPLEGGIPYIQAAGSPAARQPGSQATLGSKAAQGKHASR